MWKNIFVYVVFPIIIVVLAYFLTAGISEPARFDKVRKHREELTVQRLKDIRTLQVAYKSEYGKYASTFDTLTNFYKEGQLRVVRQIGSMDDSLAVAQGLVKRDTIRVAVKDTLLRRADFVIDSISMVPMMNKQFEMRTAIRSVSGVELPLFEACVSFDVLLAGLDRQLIVNLKDDNEKMNRYPGVKVGNTDQPNNNAGNWE